MTRLFPPEHQASILASVQADITRPGKLNVRRHRSYPRVVRRARHNHYKVKRPGQHGTRHDGPTTVRLTRAATALNTSGRSHVVTSTAARRARAGRVGGRLQQAKRVVIKV